jgi:hypothetical protein
MRSIPVNMAKNNSLYGRGEKPLTFRQAMKRMLNMPKLTHKQIDELKKKGLLDKMINNK